MIPARKARPKRARPDQTECWLRRSGAFRSSKGTGRAARAKGLEVSKTKARSSGVRSVVGAGPATALATTSSCNEWPTQRRQRNENAKAPLRKPRHQQQQARRSPMPARRIHGQPGVLWDQRRTSRSASGTHALMRVWSPKSLEAATFTKQEIGNPYCIHESGIKNSHRRGTF